MDRKYILTNIMHWNIQVSDKFDTQLFFIGAEDHFIGSATSAKAVNIQRFDSFDQFFSTVEKHFAPVHATSAFHLFWYLEKKIHMMLINEWEKCLLFN